MNLGFPEMLFIFLLALIIFGPKKLPEIGRQIGKALAEFKRASNEFKSQLETEMRQLEVEEALRKEKESITRALEAPAGTVNAGSSDSQKIEAANASSDYNGPYPPPYNPDPYALLEKTEAAPTAPTVAAESAASPRPADASFPHAPTEAGSDVKKGTDA
jgi:sec-independent protein translocase protein TatB